MGTDGLQGHERDSFERDELQSEELQPEELEPEAPQPEELQPEVPHPDAAPGHSRLCLAYHLGHSTHGAVDAPGAGAEQDHGGKT